MDDVSVLRDPDGARQQLIQNGDFENLAGNVHWRLLGDHKESRIIVDPDNPANHVLLVAASAPSRTSHNHIESSFVANTPIADGQVYEVSYRGRWRAGSPQLNTSAYFSRLARTTLLNMPMRHGTPCQVNSRRVPNAGPTFSRLQHSPVIPKTNEIVNVTVRAEDPDGVGSVTLFYRVNPATTYTNVPMALQADGSWGAAVPGFGAGKIVQFYVEAEDSLGGMAFAPDRGPDSRALYQVADAQKAGAKLTTHELRLIQLDVDRDYLLRDTNVMSQALVGGTVIYDRSEVFYDAGVQLHGSASGRARDGEDYISYDIACPATHLFRGAMGTVGIDRSGRAPAPRQQDEVYVLHMFHRAGIPCHYTDLCYFIAPKVGHTGTALLQLGAYGGSYVGEQYGVKGSVFNMDLTYEPSITVPNGTFESLKLPVPLQPHIGTDFTDLGPDLEQYRSPFDMRYGERADDYSGMMRLCQVMASPQARFEADIDGALDSDEALRITALTLLCGIADIYYQPGGLPHNLRIFTPEDGGPAHFLPWDMDFVFTGDTSASIYPDPGKNFYKLINNRVVERRYLRHVRDLCQTVFNTAYMNPWLAHYGSVVGQNYTGQSGFINARRTYALSQVPGAAYFFITSNGGNDFLTNSTVATLTGRGGLDIEAIRLAGAKENLAVTWLNATNWQVAVPLLLGSNLLSFVAYDASSKILGSDSITVTTTATGGGADTDGDGMPDAWELSNGLNPALNDATLDKDGDGLTNLQEYLTGTNPRDPRDFLRLEAGFDGGDARLSFFAVAGRSYSVLFRDEAGTGVWSKFADAPARATNRVAEVLIQPPPPVPSRFYRLVTPQQ